MGGQPDVRFKPSHQQNWIFKQLQPIIEGLGLMGEEQLGMPGMGMPSAPRMPSAAGVPLYDVPDISTMMPTYNWWGDISPEIREGIRAPYEDASLQMMEQMGARGQIGGESTPYSGTGQAALGEFWADAGTGMAQQGWSMVSPALRQGWQAGLGRNITGYQAGIQDWQSEKDRLLQDYTSQKQAWGMPFELLGLTQATMPYPVVSQQPNYLGGLVGAGAGAAMGGAALGPWGAVGGGLSGLLGAI
jgi:hypothetical protein